MNDDFKPPIKSRSTEDLLLIVGSPKKWNPKALHLAQQELYLRKIDFRETEDSKNASKLEEKKENQDKANLSFKFFKFNILHPHIPLDMKEILLFLFSWELEKDGFIRKHEFQRKYRPIVFLIILILIIYSFTF